MTKLIRLVYYGKANFSESWVIQGTAIVVAFPSLETGLPDMVAIFDVIPQKQTGDVSE